MLDIRVATLPTVEGEKVVDAPARQVEEGRRRSKSSASPTDMRRQLPSDHPPADRRAARHRADRLRQVDDAVRGAQPRSTGPRSTSSRSRTRSSTGSPGINQVQINPRAGLTFASALRSILRSDPDVVMVGEIRDAETAKISIEAALTGHLVLSTLHTNDAPGAITRLNEMGVEPFLTGAAVTGGARAAPRPKALRALLRDVRPVGRTSCSQPRLARGEAASDGMAFYRKKGCPRCGQTGYKGRIGVYQLLVMTEEIESLAVQAATREEPRGKRDRTGHALPLGRRPGKGRVRDHLARGTGPCSRVAALPTRYPIRVMPGAPWRPIRTLSDQRKRLDDRDAHSRARARRSGARTGAAANDLRKGGHVHRTSERDVFRRPGAACARSRTADFAPDAACSRRAAAHGGSA